MRNKAPQSETMTIPQQIAKALRELHFGGNWTGSNLKAHLADVTWQQATTRVDQFNTVATLVHHCAYYITVATKVLEGGPLEGTDADSFVMREITTEEDWQALLSRVWTEAEYFATLVEQLPTDILDATFGAEKYGNYYRNLQGIVEHTHYHLGQIVLLKRLIGKVGE